MNRLLKAAGVVVCALGFGVGVAQAQLATVTASSIKIGGTAISTGTALFLPVDGNEIPLAFSQGGGGLNAPAGFVCTITTGALVSCDTVPDACLASPPGLLYNVTITDTSTGNPTSGKSFTLHKVPSVCGTFALDSYSPTTSIPQPTFQGGVVPNGITAPFFTATAQKAINLPCDVDYSPSNGDLWCNDGVLTFGSTPVGGNSGGTVQLGTPSIPATDQQSAKIGFFTGGAGEFFNNWNVTFDGDMVATVVGLQDGRLFLGKGEPIGSGLATNSDFAGYLAISSATTIARNWDDTHFTTKPIVSAIPDFDLGSGVRMWVVTTTTGFTVHFSTAVTGNIAYSTIGLN